MRLVGLAALGAVVGLLTLAWWMTGPAPKPVGEGATKTAPPLVLEPAASADKPLAAAARSLAEGEHRSAERQFTSLVAERPDEPLPQTGLILSRWRTLGPRSVVRDLEQLAREYPESAGVQLHLGLARLLGQAPEAEAAFAAARKQGWETGELTTARRADDLLHPRMAPGYPPLLVRADDLGTPQARRVLAQLVLALGADDRPAARRIAVSSESLRAQEPLLAVAAAVASYDKDRPSVSVQALEAAARQSGARGAADLHRGLALLWAGDRTRGVRLLASVRGGHWGEQSAAIAARLQSPKSG